MSTYDPNLPLMPTTSTISNVDLAKHLQHLDTMTATLSANLAGQQDNIDKLTRSFDNFHQDVTRWMQTSGRPNWGWFLGGGSLIVAILGLAASPFLRDLSRVESKTNDNLERLNAVYQTRWSSMDHQQYALDMDTRFRSIERLTYDNHDAERDWRLEHSIEQARHDATIDERLRWIAKRLGEQ